MRKSRPPHVITITMTQTIQHYTELIVYRNAVEAAVTVHCTARAIPEEETQTLTEPLLVASRAVGAAIATAWGRRRYKTPFIAKLSIAESAANETQFWLEMAERCGYLKLEERVKLENDYGQISAQLAKMIATSHTWLLRPEIKSEPPGGSSAEKSPTSAVTPGNVPF